MSRPKTHAIWTPSDREGVALRTACGREVKEGGSAPLVNCKRPGESALVNCESCLSVIRAAPTRWAHENYHFRCNRLERP